MTRSKHDLKDDLTRLIELRDQAAVAVANARRLLDKADERRVQENDRRWNRITDDLERAHDLAKSSLTTYEQRIKVTERHLEELQRLGRTTIQEYLPGEESPIELDIPVDLRAAERLLSLPLDALSEMTIDQVSEMHNQLFEEQERETTKAAPTTFTATADTALAARIEHARRRREAMEASRRPSNPSGASFVERRRQILLRSGITKLMEGRLNNLVQDEVEALIECRKTLAVKPDPSPNDTRLKGIIDSFAPELEERAAALRKKAMQRYQH